MAAHRYRRTTKQCQEKLKKLKSVFCLGCQFLGLCLLQLRDAEMNTINFNTYLLVSVIVVGLDGFHKLGKCTFILTGETKKQGQSMQYQLYGDKATNYFKKLQ
uniref:Uncharacterized protein n=1 Tax=Amphiprion percula TaxID=161767 RepID=A0A3P8U8T4_AMPPE